ncbi:hypothetical protein BJX99DRAFT_252308 [Aspergillus californicus]
MWQCFPGQKAPLNENPNPCSHTQSDQYPTDAEPPRTESLSPPWNQVQEPAAAKISTLHRHGDSASCSAPFEEIIHVKHVWPPYEIRLSQLEEAEITCLVFSRGGTSTKILSYAQVQSSPGGSKALDRYQKDQVAPVSFNTTPPLLKGLPMEHEGRKPMWIQWFRWVLKSKHRPYCY